MKAMTKLVALLLFASMFIGCSRNEQGAAATPQEVTQSSSTETTTRQLRRPLPHGVTLSFAYNLRRDRIEEVKPGVFQRRIRIEYLDLDQQGALAAIKADMIAARYRAGEPRLLPDGRIRIGFGRGKDRHVIATIREGGKLQHPSADGAIQIDFPAKAPAKSSDTGAKSQ